MFRQGVSRLFRDCFCASACQQYCRCFTVITSRARELEQFVEVGESSGNRIRAHFASSPFRLSRFRSGFLVAGPRGMSLLDVSRSATYVCYNCKLPRCDCCNKIHQCPEMVKLSLCHSFRQAPKKRRGARGEHQSTGSALPLPAMAMLGLGGTIVTAVRPSSSQPTPCHQRQQGQKPGE